MWSASPSLHAVVSFQCCRLQSAWCRVYAVCAVNATSFAGEMPGGPMMDPLVRGPGPPQGRHSMQLPQGGDMRSAMWAQRGGPGQPAGMAAGPPSGQQRQSRGMHDMPYYPGSRGVTSPHRQAMRSSALAAGGAAEQHGAQGQQPPRSSRPQRAAAQIARQNNFAADPLEFMDGSL